MLTRTHLYFPEKAMIYFDFSANTCWGLLLGLALFGNS